MSSLVAVFLMFIIGGIGVIAENWGTISTLLSIAGIVIVVIIVLYIILIIIEFFEDL